MSLVMSNTAAVLNRLSGARVGCVGDVMLDRYVVGSVQRISPEAPVPVLHVEREDAMPGGAGNVVRNLAALGARIRFASVVGDDDAGRALQEQLSALEGVERATLLTEPGRRTTVKTRFLAHGQQLLRADDETCTPLPAPQRRALLEAVGNWRDVSPAVIILSDYAKGVLLDGVAEALNELSRAQGTLVVLDPKGADFSRYRGASIITPNRHELAIAAGGNVAKGEEADCARALRTRHDLSAVLVTLGREGMLLIDEQDQALALPAESREVFDVSGAGDTVVATLAAALAAGATLPEAAALANAAAGIVVGKVGTAVVRISELADVTRRSTLRNYEAKVCDRATVADRAAVWRRQGLSVGFTNGCFDLIHPGHISLLAQAKAECDRLVVGLNTDASVTRLKGAGRPVQPEAARATVLASLTAVDAVVPFAEDTPLETILAVHPDVLVKGGDYRLEQVVGAEEVRRWGGRVHLARLEPGFSTTATIASLAPLP
jgi:D-beta-D-heptose 7-phosphate kinase/D-beta-D-heptose 1-phosphate adenosyltransferase